MYRDDAVLEFRSPVSASSESRTYASGETAIPASTIVEFREIRGTDDLWVVELSISYDEGPRNFGVSILEFRDGKIARESIYVAEGWEPPEWRAEWRSAP
jgi:hypothetical protein